MDYGQLAAPPRAPEAPEGALRHPAWPWWFAPLGLAGAFFVVSILLGVVGTVVSSGSDEQPPVFVILATLMQSLVFLATAIGFASLIKRPRAWQFGLRPTRFWPAVGWAAAGMAAFYAIAAIYGAVVHTNAQQETVQDLGAGDGTLGLVIAGIMVMAVAPVAEEFFFRGFFYRSLRTNLAVGWAAAIGGLVFGLIHFQADQGLDGLLLILPLGVLGTVFCLVYEKTGSILPCIAMHAVNNSIAFAVQADGGWVVSVIVGPIVLIAVALSGRLLPGVLRPQPA